MTIPCLINAFDGVGEVTSDGEGGWKVTLTNDVNGTIELPDNLGGVTIDLNGHDMKGDDGCAGAQPSQDAGEDGKPAILVVPDDGAEGETRTIEWQILPQGYAAGEYFYKTLFELGYDVPTNGTVYNVVAKGLPAGLKLKYNAAVKNTKGKVVTKAKTTWWIEGVPTKALDFYTNPPYLVITVGGGSATKTLPVEVLDQEVVDLGELALGETVNTNKWLSGVGKNWTVSGLPTGLKFATKKVTKTSGGKTVTVAYSCTSRRPLPTSSAAMPSACLW